MLDVSESRWFGTRMRMIVELFAWHFQGGNQRASMGAEVLRGESMVLPKRTSSGGCSRIEPLDVVMRASECVLVGGRIGRFLICLRFGSKEARSSEETSRGSSIGILMSVVFCWSVGLSVGAGGRSFRLKGGGCCSAMCG